MQTTHNFSIIARPPTFTRALARLRRATFRRRRLGLAPERLIADTHRLGWEMPAFTYKTLNCKVQTRQVESRRKSNQAM